MSPGISHKYIAFVSFTSFCIKQEILLLVVCNLLSLEFSDKEASKNNCCGNSNFNFSKEVKRALNLIICEVIFISLIPKREILISSYIFPFVFSNLPSAALYLIGIVPLELFRI